MESLILYSHVLDVIVFNVAYSERIDDRDHFGDTDYLHQCFKRNLSFFQNNHVNKQKSCCTGSIARKKIV